MSLTAERFSPVSSIGAIEPEHWHRYALARQFVTGKDVLDIASGEGYGSHYLAEKAKSVIGVDIFMDAVNFAKSKYISKNLEYRNGSCAAIPLTDHSVDVVVSFETIEHHTLHEEMFSEIKRVLRPGGLLIISSPDKHNYSDAPNFKNEFHVKELYKHEFEGLVKKYFKHYSIVGQRLFSGSLIAPESDFQVSQKQTQTNFNYIETEEGPIEENWLKHSIYLIALASDMAVPEISWSILESNYLQRIYDHQFQIHQENAARLNQSLENSRNELSKVYSSRSWRVTAFLRYLTHHVKKIKKQK
jgi:ubiquinone/menaquinone biosynthesis C-methylase UbiE